MEDLERGSVEEEDFNKCRLFLETYHVRPYVPYGARTEVRTLSLAGPSE